MTNVNVHASRVFFNEISNEIQELRLLSQYFQAYIERAKERVGQTRDCHSVALLEHLESFLENLKERCSRLEKICEKHVALTW
jgi:hypothetical protein